jgi:hypothetical protein
MKIRFTIIKLAATKDPGGIRCGPQHSRQRCGVFGTGRPHGIPGIHLWSARVWPCACGGSGVIGRKRSCGSGAATRGCAPACASRTPGGFGTDAGYSRLCRKGTADRRQLTGDEVLWWLDIKSAQQARGTPRAPRRQEKGRSLDSQGSAQRRLQSGDDEAGVAYTGVAATVHDASVDVGARVRSHGRAKRRSCACKCGAQRRERQGCRRRDCGGRCRRESRRACT